MWIEVKRSKKNGRFIVVVHHESTTYFWEFNNTEAVVFHNEKDKMEITLAIDLWNRNYHEEFELLWNKIMNLDTLKSYFLHKYKS